MSCCKEIDGEVYLANDQLFSDIDCELTNQRSTVVKRLMVRFTWPMVNSLVILIVS